MQWWFIILVPLVMADGDYLDIGMQYFKKNDVFYWANDVIVQLVYQIPLPPSMEEFTKPRCDYALSARRSLYSRFRNQFPDVTELGVYKGNCTRFENDSLFITDNEKECLKCFHISSDNDPYYLECLTLLEMRSLCTSVSINNNRQKRDTREHFVLSNIAVSLAESAKMQDDRITSKFEKEHNLQKESVNFQLLFLNTFRWQLSVSELWFLHYVQSDPELFAKILVHMSGILEKTRDLTQSRLNTSLSQDWRIQSTDRNVSHVTVNISFTSFHEEYRAYLYHFRFLPVKYGDFYFAINGKDAHSLKCGKIVAELEPFDANYIDNHKFIPDSPCHTNHKDSKLQDCMAAVLNREKEAKKICLKNAQKVQEVNSFYFLSDDRVWIPNKAEIRYSCHHSPEQSITVESNSVLTPQCGCEYLADGRQIPPSRTCSTKFSFHQIRSNFTLPHGSIEPFFLGKIQNDTPSGPWASSATNRLSQKVLTDSQSVEDYFRKKMEEEASTSGEWKFKFRISSFWLLLPVAGILLFGGLFCLRCKNEGFHGFMGGMPAPVVVNYCSHNETQPVNLRPNHEDYSNRSRVVSWPAGQNPGTKV